MKKVQKTLTAALAATLATGIVGSVANAETVNEIYNAAYNATQSALAKKDQVSINEARAAIAKLPAEYKNYASTFSGLVDTVQQPIYVNILSALEKAQKENNQANINAARKMLVGVEKNYANTWSAELDKSQQALVKKAQDACDKATKSGDAKDIKEAQTLIADIKTVEANDTVKTFIEKYETEFTTALNMTALEATVDNATTLTVKFNREVNADTVAKDDFIVKNGTLKSFAKDFKISEDKKSITITVNKLDENKDYSLVVRGIKDTKGKEIKETSFDVKYEKKEVKAIDLKREKVVRKESIKDLVVVKDAADRDITGEVKIKVESSDKDAITSEGKVTATAKIGKEISLKISVGDFSVDKTVVVTENLAEELAGVTIGKDFVDTKTKMADVTLNQKMNLFSTAKVSLFVKNTDGKVVVIQGKDLKLTSSDTAVVKTNGSGVIESRSKAGTALITAKYGNNFEQTFEVTVTEDNFVDATINLNKEAVSVAKNKQGNTVEFSVTDNSTGTKDVDFTAPKVEVYNSDSGKWEVNSKIATIDSSAKGLVKVLPTATSTRARVVVKYNGGLVTKEFDIVADDAKEATGYELVVLQSGKSIDELNQNADDQVNEKATLVVYTIDDNGNRVGQLTDKEIANIVVNGDEVRNEDANGKLTGSSFTTNGTDTIEVLKSAVGSYKLSVKVYDKKNQELKGTTNEVTLTVSNNDKKTGKIETEYTEVVKGVTFADMLSCSYDGADTTTGAAVGLVIVDENGRNQYIDATKETVKDGEYNVKCVVVNVKDENGAIKTKKAVIAVNQRITVSFKK